MRIIKHHKFGTVNGFELGYAPVGKPWMTVYFYILDDTMIDSGQSHMRRAVLKIISAYNIKQLLITHHHEDHSGNAAAVKKALQIPVYAHALCAAKMKKAFNILPYQKYVWGAPDPVDILPLPTMITTSKRKLKPIFVPGHSKDLTVYLEANEGWLFTGDLYLGDRIKYFRVDEKINDQITSTKKILKYDFDVLYCAHRPRLKNGKKHMQNKLDFLQSFVHTVQTLNKQGMSVNEIVQHLPVKESNGLKTFTFGNVSLKNMVLSVFNRQGQCQ